MVRLTKFLLPALIALHLVLELFIGPQSIFRDFFLYNLIWVVALVTVFFAPVAFDQVALAAIALAIFFWGAGSLATSFDQLLREFPSFTLSAQVGYSLFYPLILVAIPRLSSTSLKLKPIEILDALIVGLGFTSIVSTILLVVIFPANSLLGSENFFLIFYPVGDIALLIFSITTLITRGFDKKSLLFSAGILVFTITDFYYLWLAINNQYSFGGIADDGWLIAISLMAIAVTFPGSRTITSSQIHPALVALSIFISPILLAISALRPNIFPVYIVIPAIANLLLAFIRLSTALREARILVDERMLARTDELTGLANRRLLLAEIENFSEVEGALLLLDLNEFKPVNDLHGHEVGDLVLREVARRFTRVLPNDAILARLGGDEFGVLVEGSYEETLEVAYALRAALSYPFNLRGMRIDVGVSVGHVQNDGAGALLQRADSAMYRAKSSDMGVAQS
ncbi:GGDEF domain [Candidatus Nanopelagicaceae bacterium]